MTKADIVNEIAKSTGVEKVMVQTIVEAFMDNVRNSLIENNPVYLRGFGSFIIKKRATKVARNISKNTTITIPEHNIPAFKPAKSFVAKVKTVKIKIQNIIGSFTSKSVWENSFLITRGFHLIQKI